MRKVTGVILILAPFLICSLVYGGHRVRSVDIAGREYLFLRDISGFYGMQYSANGSKARLQSSYSSLSFQVNKRRATLNGVTTYLSEACAEWQNEILLSRKDFNLMLEPILRTDTLNLKPIRRIVLDPGHGGKDNGTAPGGIKEKDINLKIALRLGKLLREMGYTVYFTRRDDRFLSLDQRTRYANRKNADLFLSLHANYVANSSVQGIETYILTPTGTPSTYSYGRKHERDLGNRYDKYNSRLAFEIQQNVVDVTSATDRGIKHADFAVLKDVSCPAALIETGFLSNSEEKRKLRSNRYQSKIATGIGRGIRLFQRALIKADTHR